LPDWFEEVLNQKVKQSSKQFLENMFSEIEGEAITVLRCIIDQIEKGNFKTFKEKEKIIISDFAFLQYSRTKVARIDVGQRAVETYREIGHSAIEKNFPIDEYPKEIYPTATITNDGEKDLHLVTLFESIANRELRRKLHNDFYSIILKNNTVVPFITSDHPVVTFPHKKSPVGPISAFYQEGNEIIFPVSPKYLIIFLEKNHFSKIASKGQIGKKKKHFMTIDIPLYVEFYNFLQARYSNRFLFSQDSDFSIITRTMNKYPEVLLDKVIKHESVSIEDKTTGKEYLVSRSLDRGIHEGKYLGKSFFKSYMSKL